MYRTRNLHFLHVVSLPGFKVRIKPTTMLKVLNERERDKGARIPLGCSMHNLQMKIPFR